MGQTLGKSKLWRSSCSICMEGMPSNDISALRCGHLFHFRCIKYWLSEQDTCPECRKPSCLDDVVTPLYFHDLPSDKEENSDSDSSDDSEKLDNYYDLLRKLGDTYVELEKEKARHDQTKELLDKAEQEKVQLITTMMSGNMRSSEGQNSSNQN